MFLYFGRKPTFRCLSGCFSIVSQTCGLHMTRPMVGVQGLSFIFTLVLLGVDWLCFIQNRTGIWHKQIQLLWSWTWLHRDTLLRKGIDGIEQICVPLWMKRQSIKKKLFGYETEEGCVLCEYVNRTTDSLMLTLKFGG